MGLLRPATTVSLALVLAAAPGPAPALETDPFYAWDRDLADAAPFVNARVNLEIGAVLERINASDLGTTRSCDDVVDAILRHFRLFIFHDLELWVTNTSLIERAPGDPDAVRNFRDHYVYRDTSELDPVEWMPPSPTIEVDGIRIGTDKLTHFFSEGSFYRRWYLDAIDDGVGHDEAVDLAIRRGIRMERTFLGWLASGVLSLADLEANEQGMHWLVGMCHGPSPELRLTDGRWTLSPPFDIRRHVAPSWDESWRPNLYSPSRWGKVRPVLSDYCDLVDSEQVRTRRALYASRDRESATARIVAAAVAEGRLPDPETFRIERVCAVDGEPKPLTAAARP